MIDETIEQVWRADRTRLVARIARRTGDIALAEDVVQDAFAASARDWRRNGVPANAAAWIWTVAWRRALDIIRAAKTHESILSSCTSEDTPYVVDDYDDGDLRLNDDVLGLILACAHPAIAFDARVALTLRHVDGLSAHEIAAAFVVSVPTMEKRLVRARAKLKTARISLAVPPADQLADRLEEARTVMWLIFTQGHLASGEGPPIRIDLCDEAIRLARALVDLEPRDPENLGLLALLLFTHARTPARTDASVQLVPFEQQDRHLWNCEMIREGRMLLAKTASCAPGRYCIEAAVAALHTVAGDAEVRWDRIVELYAILHRIAPSELVDVNRAYAIGRAGRPEAGLDALRSVHDSGRLMHYAPLHAATADLLERSGRPSNAMHYWRRAAIAATNGVQRKAYIERSSTRSR